MATKSETVARLRSLVGGAGIADEYIWVCGVVDPDAFAMRIVGDSMAPEYMEGDLVVFSPNLTPVSGQDCYVRLVHDDEATFKRVYFDHQDNEAGWFRLCALNPRYREQRVAREDVSALAVCSMVVRTRGTRR